MAPGVQVVGLGPGDPRWLTRGAWAILQDAREIYLRTAQHPIVDHLPEGPRIYSFDGLYEEHVEFDEVYQAIIARVLELGRRANGVVYAVPGDPTVGEATVLGIRERAGAAGLPVEMVHGVSFIEPCLNLVGLDGMEKLTILDALQVAARHHPQVSTASPALIGQLYSRLVASDVKLTLMNAYPDDHAVVLIHEAGLDSGFTEYLPLHEIDTSPNIGSLSTLFVPPLAEYSGFERLQETIAHLRAPEGCPWDREQTHQSLRQHLLEEAYETLHAIDQDDISSLREELGDLLLQIVLQAQIATESESFRMADVIAAVNDKLIRRHPHVFGDLELSGVDEVLHNWEALKASERDQSQAASSVLTGVPVSLPALALALEYQARAARLGFDWPSVSGVREKITEEIEEFQHASTPEAQEAEFGDLLFSLVNYARWKKLDPEAALRGAALRFRERFERMEAQARSQDKDLRTLDLEELERLWTLAKRN